jgi:hypothetical protein
VNAFLVNSPPQLEFEEVSIEQNNWRERFIQLVRQKKPITYDVCKLPTIAKDIRDELNKNGYHAQILKSDQDRYFLISN